MVEYLQILADRSETNPERTRTHSRGRKKPPAIDRAERPDHRSRLNQNEIYLGDYTQGLRGGVAKQFLRRSRRGGQSLGIAVREVSFKKTQNPSLKFGKDESHSS